MTRILTPIGRRRRAWLLISQDTWYGLGIGMLIGAGVWIVIWAIAQR